MAFAELQARVRQMQGPRTQQAMQTLPELAGLLPDGLQCGAAYSIPYPAQGATSLASALLAGPSGAGHWTAVVGMPDFGAEAAAAVGMDLSRTILVPEPGTSWMTVTSTLADVLDVVLVRPVTQVYDAEAARLGARLRKRGSTLLVLGRWPSAQASLRVERSAWVGLGEGHGRLRGRAVVLQATDRAGRTRTTRTWLPEPRGHGVLEKAPAVLDRLLDHAHDPSRTAATASTPTLPTNLPSRPHRPSYPDHCEPDAREITAS